MSSIAKFTRSRRWNAAYINGCVGSVSCVEYIIVCSWFHDIIFSSIKSVHCPVCTYLSSSDHLSVHFFYRLLRTLKIEAFFWIKQCNRSLARLMFLCNRRSKIKSLLKVKDYTVSKLLRPSFTIKNTIFADYYDK